MNRGIVTVIAVIITLGVIGVLQTRMPEPVNDEKTIVARDAEPLRAEARPSGETHTYSIPVVAVTVDGSGTVAELSLTTVPGSGHVFISTKPYSLTDVQHSLTVANEYAREQIGDTQDNYLYEYRVNGPIVIGGESAGAAATILTYAALSGKELRDDVVITGTIQPDGRIGYVGGIVQKMEAAGEQGYEYFLVPEGQLSAEQYQYVEEEYPVESGFVRRAYYAPVNIDIAKYAEQEWGLTVVEVGSVDEALPYFFN